MPREVAGAAASFSESGYVGRLEVPEEVPPRLASLRGILSEALRNTGPIEEGHVTRDCMRPSPSAQPCERLWLDIQVDQDLTKEAPTDLFSFVNGNNCRAAVRVLSQKA